MCTALQCNMNESLRIVTHNQTKTMAAFEEDNNQWGWITKSIRGLYYDSWYVCLKENEIQTFTSWYVKRTSKHTFCRSGHIRGPQNDEVQLNCKCWYRLLQMPIRFTARRHFVWKSRDPPRRNDEIALFLLALIHMQVYDIHNSRSPWAYNSVPYYRWASRQQEWTLFQKMREILL